MRPVIYADRERHVRGRSSRGGFTLVEMLVSFAVLALIMVMISQLFNSAMAVTGARSKQMDVDAQTRGFFDRMAIDIAQMVKRPDVDYFLKSSATDQYGNKEEQTGNDQLAFYSQVPGYYPSTSGTGEQSPVSLVAYRVNSENTSPYYNKVQRYGFGLLWNGVATSGTTQMIFSSGPLGATSVPGSNNAISNNWPVATNMTADPNYELAGPQIFRFEYYYVLKGQIVGGKSYSSILSDVPWDLRIPNHTTVNGLQDVAAIGVVVAVLDPKSLGLVKSGQLANVAAVMEDFPHTTAKGDNTTQPGGLEAEWETGVRSAVTAQFIPRAVAPAIRIYGRTFYLPPN